jgi:tRNA(Ile)-lysidine synthase
MLQEFAAYIKTNKLCTKRDRILLAVSGGIDSMVMASLFLSSGFHCGIAHCNFRLRGKESDTDQKFVRKFASKHGVPFHTANFDTSGFAADRGISIQMSARELRYSWFKEIRKQHGYRYIALAHNENDNIETFLINLSRGTGIAGLTGMKPSSGRLIRPLLFASRELISDYCKANRIQFREDSSNAEVKYTRNKIRHRIIPLFREINPSFEGSVNETIERLNDINEIYTSFMESTRKNIIQKSGGTDVIRLESLEKLSPARTFLYEIFKPYGITSGQADDLVKLCFSKTGSRLHTRTHRIIKNRDEIIIEAEGGREETHIIIRSISDFANAGHLFIYTMKTAGKKFTIPRENNIACLDAGRIVYPVVIRNWKIGDYFYPLGMKSRKKLSDYFTDRKYSLSEKEACLVLESGGEIAWIIGERIDDRFKITGKTKRALILESKISRDLPV